MEAVIDPEALTCVGFVLPNTTLYNTWANCVCVSVTDDLVGKPLKVQKEGDSFVLSLDDSEVLAQAWTAVRTQQRQKLYESDWTCSVTDYEVPNKPEWVQYRAQLRDVTLQSDPFAIEWPTAPEA
jgi:hypothetical protein